VRFGLSLCALSLAVPVRAGTVAGKVELLDSRGRPASDLADVVVYVDGVPGSFQPPRAITATITMKGMRFNPHLTVVRVSEAVKFENEDFPFHNPFSVSGANSFDFGLFTGNSRTRTFQHRGSVRVHLDKWGQSYATRQEY
jgi:hypothetical protein